MANIKFSDFTGGASIVQADHFLVGFDTDATAGGSNPKNNKWTFTQVAAGLAEVTATPYSIYAGDGTITTGRKALLAGTLQFRNAGDTSDILKLNTDGTFTLGLDAIAQGVSAVTIGQLAETTVSNSVAIGYNAEAAGGIAIGQNADNNQSYSQCIGGNTSNAAQYQTVIGYDADGLAGADRSIAIGASAKAAAQGGIVIGVSSTAQNHCIVLGRNVGVSGTPDNSVVFATRGGNNITYSEANTFTWYNTSDTVPDLKIVGGGESTLRTSLKITGQGYSELHTVTSAASITPDWNNSNVQTFELTSASTTIVNPSNIKPGATYILILKQDSTGGRTVSFGTQYNFPADTAPTLTTTANKADVITLVAYSSTVLMCTSVLDFTTT